MIDGVKCSCFGLDANLWRNNPLLDFGLSVSESTGALLTQRREAKAKDLRFVLSPTNAGSLTCSFAGSLHKYKNGNGINWDNFTFPELCQTLDDLSEKFNIDLDSAIIHTLEIGVNIELDFNPYVILKSVICHKGKRFNYLDKKDKRLGLICEYTDYAIKLYDKGHQCKISDHNKYVLRYEIKLFRQRMLTPYGITTLADLKNLEKVAPLIRLLAERLDEIIFFDFSFKTNHLTESKRLKWAQYSNPNYWENLDRDKYYKARKRYAELTAKYNCIAWEQFVLKHMTKTWLSLTKIKQKKGRHFPHDTEVEASREKATFSKLEYMLENVANGEVKERPKKETEKDREKQPRYCISCGRQITGQKQGSRFCSERIYGKEARQCRNRDSNRRLTIKRKTHRAMENDLMMRITYESEGKEYSDILGASEIAVTREWLDKVKRVEVLAPQQSTLTGKEAKDYLQTIQNK